MAIVDDPGPFVAITDPRQSRSAITGPSRPTVGAWDQLVRESPNVHIHVYMGFCCGVPYLHSVLKKGTCTCIYTCIVMARDSNIPCI